MFCKLYDLPRAKVCNSRASPTKVWSGVPTIKRHEGLRIRDSSRESLDHIIPLWIHPVSQEYCAFLQLYALQTFAYEK
jgi:hypothetical protein